jgi:hypothetical protein
MVATSITEANGDTTKYYSVSDRPARADMFAGRSGPFVDMARKEFVCWGYCAEDADDVVSNMKKALPPKSLLFSVSIIITLGILVLAPKINAGPRPLTTRFAKYRALKGRQLFFQRAVAASCEFCGHVSAGPRIESIGWSAM